MRKLKSKVKNVLRNYQAKQKFHKEVKLYKEKNTTNFKIIKENLLPILNDWDQNAGTLDSHYFLQDISMARKIFLSSPEEHYDVGSRVDGFISHLLCFRKSVTMIDIRPLQYEIEGLNFLQADATNMTGIEDCSIESLSSLHAVEHFGLGRYGDPIDPDASFKAMQSFQRVLKPGGFLYFSVPVGNVDTLYYNAHRVFSPYTIVDRFSTLKLLEFSLLCNYKIQDILLFDAKGKMTSTNFGDYSCGLFLFQKPEQQPL